MLMMVIHGEVSNPTEKGKRSIYTVNRLDGEQKFLGEKASDSRQLRAGTRMVDFLVWAMPVVRNPQGCSQLFVLQRDSRPPRTPYRIGSYQRSCMHNAYPEAPAGIMNLPVVPCVWFILDMHGPNAPYLLTSVLRQAGRKGLN